MSRCKGQIYRAAVTVYETSRGFALTIKLNYLKKKSCKGCGYCHLFIDVLGDAISCYEDEVSIIGFEKVEHGKLYTLQAVPSSRDLETGLVDDYVLELVEIKE